MRLAPEWTVVLEGSVFVRTDVQTAAASGLFGLLADSRVQIVRAGDEARMVRFLALGDTPGVVLYPGLFVYKDDDGAFSPSRFLEAVESSKAWLSAAERRMFGSEESRTRFHTAVMFRLCTKMGGADR